MSWTTKEFNGVQVPHYTDPGNFTRVFRIIEVSESTPLSTTSKVTITLELLTILGWKPLQSDYTYYDRLREDDSLRRCRATTEKLKQHASFLYNI